MVIFMSSKTVDLMDNVEPQYTEELLAWKKENRRLKNERFLSMLICIAGWLLLTAPIIAFIFKSNRK